MPGSAPGQFSAPEGVATDGAGNVYIADRVNNLVQKFTTDGVFISAWGSHGTGDGQFATLWGIAVGPNGLVFTTDDAHALYEELKARGVTDFTQEPTDHFYGTDMGIRDPFGNPIRILQQGKVAAKATA